MRIHYLHLKNYRQYRDARLDFSTDPDSNFTIIQGSNGAGKSNLLNAITWCLYGEERHLNEEAEGLPLINEKIYSEIEPGSSKRVEVKMGLGEDELEYRIQREATAYRREDGDISVREESDPVVSFRAKNDWRNSPQPTYTINQLVPEGISQFFFFDGERLDEFFRENSAQKVRKGIIRVSQIDLLKQSIGHLENFNSNLRGQVNAISPELKRLRSELESVEDKLESEQEKLERLEQEREEITENINDIKAQLRNSDQEEVADLQQDRDDLEDHIEDQEGLLKQFREEASEVLVELGPRIYALKALEKTRTLLEERAEHGDLPPKVREPFFSDLLNEEECVCGNELAEGSEARRKVKNRMEKVVSENYGGLIEGKFKVGPLIDEIPELTDRLKNEDKNIWKIEDDIDRRKQEVKEISEKIEKYGGEVDLEEIQSLEQQLREYKGDRDEKIEEIGRQRREIEDLQEKKKKRNKELQNALEQDQRQEDLLARLQFCDSAEDALEAIRSELLSEVREEIESKTDEYFADLIWKKGTYKKVKLDEDYQINVLNVRDMPSLGSLSAGERQVLALSFMAALGRVSGFDAPVVIDTPIGRISGEPRKNIAEALPNYLPDTQITMLVTDTEYTDEVRMRLDPRVGQEYHLDFDEEQATTNLIAQ
jgi:DNA sulfur modification protein DndD